MPFKDGSQRAMGMAPATLEDFSTILPQRLLFRITGYFLSPRIKAGNFQICVNRKDRIWKAIDDKPIKCQVRRILVLLFHSFSPTLRSSSFH